MKSLYVNNVNLTETYGLMISGSGTYSIPTRSYEAYSVNGRSGDVLIDNGRFNNVEVTYPCWISSDFDTNYRNLMSFLLSTTGYVRIEDDYDTEHYRMGYLSAEVIPELTTLNRAGSFDLVFNCQPQRWLKSGETEILFDNYDNSEWAGGTITNPTLYTANPLFYIIGNDDIISASETPSTVTAISCSGGTYTTQFIGTNGFWNTESIWDTISRNVVDADPIEGTSPLLSHGIRTFTFTELPSGDTAVRIRAGIKVRVIPRWWEI